MNWFKEKVSRWTQGIVLLLVVAGTTTSPLFAQNYFGVQTAEFKAKASATVADGKINGQGTGEILQTGCAACGEGLLEPPVIGPGICSGCSGKGCYPGRRPCDFDWQPRSGFDRFVHGIYTSLCCNDPCYEGCWKPLANAAFTVDQVRPVTQSRIGVDLGFNVKLPDKAELFWARVQNKGPKLPGAAQGAVVPGERSLDYQDIYMYTEGAVDRFGMFVQVSYRNVDPRTYPDGSGFGDMVVGTKSLLFDTELLQMTFQFRTFLPTGNAARGVGTGHTSLDPSLITALKLSEESYLQSQIGVLFPVGGTSQHQGALFYLGTSFNQLLLSYGQNIQLIGTLEGMLASPISGLYTDPDTGVFRRARNLGPFFNLGPGLRLVMCKTMDFGVGTSFALTDNNLVGQLLRFEFRYRY